MKQFFDKAGEEGGEAWLRRCLETATGSEEDGEERGAASQRRSAGQWVDEPPIRVQQRRSTPPTRFSPAAGGAEDPVTGGSVMAEDGSGRSGHSYRSGMKRRSGSLLPGGSGWRGSIKKPAVRNTRGQLSPPRTPRVKETSHEPVQQAECLVEERQVAENAVQSLLLDGMAQQGTGQLPAGGECQQFHSLSVLVDSLSALVKSLSSAINPTINPVLAAPANSLLNYSAPAIVFTAFLLILLGHSFPPLWLNQCMLAITALPQDKQL